MAKMKALLDTNIIIHRESAKVLNQDIGILFKWLDKAGYEKTIHQITIDEISRHQNQDLVRSFKAKMDSYVALKTQAPIHNQVKEISDKFDQNLNDRNDTALLNEIFQNRADILISEDKKIHDKAEALGLAEKVFTINSFLEKIYVDHPELVEYKVLSVQQKHFGEIDLEDGFFATLKEDYPGFDKWFNRKSNEKAYVTTNKENGKILSFLYLKCEDKNESYADIQPRLTPKKRLKVGTFKVVSNGVRLGERFLKIIFDNALTLRVDEIYVTIFDKRPEQLRLISLLEEWGFKLHGKKDSGELVFTRSFSPAFNKENPKETFPYISLRQKIFLVPIYPEYHTELMPDSILHNETKANFNDDQPHRNSIGKTYVSRSDERNIKKGDLLIFYRTGGYYKSVVTTLGIVDGVVFNIKTEEDFILQCRKRSVFTEQKLREQWNFNKQKRPFLVNFLYSYSFPKRINLKRLMELGVIKDMDDVPRGFKEISVDQLKLIIKETEVDESIIVD